MNVHIRDYLVREASRIEERQLPVLSTTLEREVWRKEKQHEFHIMLGIDRLLAGERQPLTSTITGSVNGEAFAIEKLHYQSLPGLYVTANLYVPHNSRLQPAPAVVYLCGHAPDQKVHYQAHPRRFAQLGFVVLAVDTIQFGETFGVHHGTYSHGWFHWISKGYSPAAVETWNAIRALDWLETRSEVDPARIGITGHSGGGIVSWWTAIADDRIQAVATSGGTGTTRSHIEHRTIDFHCDCYFPPNPYGWSLFEMYALVAPRPVLIVNASRDTLFHEDSVRDTYRRLGEFYREWGASEAIRYHEFYGPHSYSASSRRAIFSWLLKHLMPDAYLDEESVGDIDEGKLDKEQLEVFLGNPPGNDRSTSVQDWFIQIPANLALPDDRELLKVTKEALIKQLFNHSFATFPKTFTPPRFQTEQSFLLGGDIGEKFSYVSEEGWTIRGEWRMSEEEHEHGAVTSTAIVLRPSGDRSGRSCLGMLEGLSSSWCRMRLDLRGTGDTAWGSDLNWHVRRAAALLGRTVTSMRVWDLLQGLAALRAAGNGQRQRILLAGEGEMAVTAIFAALLDGDVDTVVIKRPPSSLNLPGSGDGTGPMTELTQVLRYIDLAQACAWLWPTKLVFVDERPDTYLWTEEQYERLGEPGGVWRVASLADWNS